MAQLTREILKDQGFEYEEQLNVYIKTVGGRTIRCYKPNVNVNGGYWVCDIWTMYEPVQNQRIVTDDDLDEFIKSTCPKDMIRMEMVEAPDDIL